MPTIVTNTADNSLVHSHVYLPSDLDLSELREDRKKLSFPSMKGQMTQWLFDGIRMGHSDLMYSKSNAVKWEGNFDVITLGFNLNGKVVLEQKEQGKSFAFTNGQHNIFYMGDSDFVMRNEDTHSEMFLIQFNKDAFLRLTEGTTDDLMRFRDEVLQGKPTVLSQHNEFINLEIQSIINAILNCHYTGGIKKMFFLSKCFEILVLQSQLFDKSEDKKYIYCKTDYDKERILFAREYIIQNFKSPPTLTGLSKITGINEFKLKKGFKEIFGTTVFNYLTEYRMEIAKTELLQKKKSVSELAYELGYSSPQHFSKAFKKMFSVPPGGMVGGKY